MIYHVRFRSQIHPIENKQNCLAKLPYPMKIMVHQLVDWWPSYDCLLKLCHWCWISKKNVGGKNQKQIFPIDDVECRTPSEKSTQLVGFHLLSLPQLGISQSKAATDKSKMWTSPHHNWNKTRRREKQNRPWTTQKYWRKRSNFADKSLDIAVLP